MQFIYSEAANETLAATPTTPHEFKCTKFCWLVRDRPFNPVQDVIEFTKGQFASFTDVQAATSAIAGGAMITLEMAVCCCCRTVDAGSPRAGNFALA